MPYPAAQALEHPLSDARRLAQRIDAQLAFARQLVDLSPAHGPTLHRAIAAAQSLCATVFTSIDPATLRRGVAQIEQVLAPAAQLAKQYTIYCVGHAHIDMNWLWGWPETVAVANDTFTTVLKLMDEFPTFVFSQSQASAYAAVQQYNPDLFDAVVQKVKDGRWEVTASHWVEGDRNMVSGEALTRHLLYTRRYFKEFFDLDPQDVPIDWSPDTFGHPLSVPMYLARGGVKYVYLSRPGGIGPKRPGAFWWQSPDGSRVLVRNDMADSYNGQLNPGITNPLVGFCKETGLNFVMYVYGVGDHGGGPTRHDLAWALEMDAWPVFPNVRFARAVDFYTRLEKNAAKLPTLTCELNTENTGCYTTQALIKRSNRLAEHRLLDAETACTIASAATGRPYPAKALELAWRDTLFGHFHDILPGSNMHDSCTWVHALFQKTIATTSMAETLALRELALRIDTSADLSADPTPASSLRATLGAGAGCGANRHMIGNADQAGGPAKPIVVFNPCAWERQDIIETTIWSDSPIAQITDEIRNRPLSIRTPQGQLIPAQKLEYCACWGHAFVRIAFPVQVPALGYATYTVVEEPSDPLESKASQITPPYHCFYLREERRREGLQNEFLQMQIDPETGGILMLDDKPDGISWSGPWHLQYLLEKPHGMSAWIIDNAVEKESGRVLAIERGQDSSYKATVDVRLKIRESEFTLTYELRAGDPMLYLHLKGTWFQRGTPQTGVLVLRFTMPLSDLEAFPLGTYEIPFGVIERDLHDAQELPALNFAMVCGRNHHKPAGLLLLNDCKHGHSVDGHTFNLTLIRSAYDPDPLPDAAQHEIHLALLPFSDQLSASRAIRLGKDFNRPLRPIGTSIHTGRLPSRLAGVSVKEGDVLITTVKQAEEGGTIIHLLNPGNAAQQATLDLNPDLLGRFDSAALVDLMECQTDQQNATLREQTLAVAVPAQALVAVRLHAAAETNKRSRRGSRCASIRTKEENRTMESMQEHLTRNSSMKVAAITGIRQCQLMERPTPRAKDDVVMVKIHAAPMCTEYHGYKSGATSDCLGHEAAGEVIEVAQAGKVKPGDRVVVMPQYPCGKCPLCLTGNYIHCEHGIDVLKQTGNVCGTATYAQYVLKQDWLLLPIPAEMSYAHASMACCGLGPTFGAMQRMGVTALDTILIVGLGPVGLGGIINGVFRAARVIGVDGHPYRAKLARELGACAVIDPAEPDALEQIKQQTHGQGVDAAIDCTAVPAAQKFAMDATRRLGQVAFVGWGGHIERDNMVPQGLTLHGCWHYPLYEAPRLMQMIGQVGAQLDKLITHRFAMSQLQQAWELQLTGNCGKVLLDPWS